jgi:hypothetical protein
MLERGREDPIKKVNRVHILYIGCSCHAVGTFLMLSHHDRD